MPATGFDFKTTPGALPLKVDSPMALLRAMDTLEAPAVGTLVAARKEGGSYGAVFLDQGRICWAVVAGKGNELAQRLQAASGMDRAALEAVVRRCLKEKKELGAELLSSGSVDEATYRRVLHDHTLDCILLLAKRGIEWWWVPRHGSDYQPVFWFSTAELLVAIGEREKPEQSRAAMAELTRVLGEESLPSWAFLSPQSCEEATVVSGLHLNEVEAQVLVSTTVDVLASLAAVKRFSERPTSLVKVTSLGSFLIVWRRDAFSYVAAINDMRQLGRILARLGFGENDEERPASLGAEPGYDSGLFRIATGVPSTKGP